MSRYESAKQLYASIGVDTDSAIEQLKKIPISMHCWQGDDVRGFADVELSGGIQTTGNYLGRARNPDELMSDTSEFIRSKSQIRLFLMKQKVDQTIVFRKMYPK